MNDTSHLSLNTDMMNGLSNIGYGAIPATAGELIQGVTREGAFLVTNPINIFSHVTVVLNKANPTISIWPPKAQKTREAVRSTLDYFDMNAAGAQVTVSSAIPLGKGMASSTADIVAAIEATARAIGKQISPEIVSHLAVNIEPSDGTMYRGVVVYRHRQGILFRQLGQGIEFIQVVADTGGVVDTQEFNRQKPPYSEDQITASEAILEQLLNGFEQSNMRMIGEASTASSILNQSILPKTCLPEILDIAKGMGAYGVACAHSGTILSLLFSTRDLDAAEQAAQTIKQMIPAMEAVSIFRSVNHW